MSGTARKGIPRRIVAASKRWSEAVMVSRSAWVRRGMVEDSEEVCWMMPGEEGVGETSDMFAV